MAKRKSPIRMAISSPQRLLMVARPRRVTALSMASSWMRVAVCISSTEAAIGRM